MKLNLEPLSENKLMVRISNLADLFDSQPSTNNMVDLQKLGSLIVKMANLGESGVDNVLIKETNLQGTVELEDLKDM